MNIDRTKRMIEGVSRFGGDGVYLDVLELIEAWTSH